MMVAICFCGIPFGPLLCRTLFELVAKTLVANAPTEANDCPKSICCKITKLAKH